MANYLSGSQIVSGNIGTDSSLVNLGANVAINQAVGSQASTALSYAGGVSNALAFAGLGGGSKPMALHTEHAGGAANWAKPYGAATDIEFFLLRADAESGDSSGGQGSATGDAGGGDVPAATSATSQTGGSNYTGSSLQSPMSQLAVGSTAPTSGSPGLVGPMTGLDSVDSVSNGGVSQSGATYGSQTAAATNAVGGATGANPYGAASREYFDSMVTTGFSSEGGTTSSLTNSMASSYPSVTSTDSLTSEVASGSAVTTPAANDAANLSGSQSSGPTTAAEIQTTDTADKIPQSWYFITPPQNVDWTKTGSSNEVQTYGTNTPYVTYGATGLRKLSMSKILVEGFSDAKTVEMNVLALESCMNMVIDAEKGYTSPYCWKLYAGSKSYGTFIITDVSVSETMRDMSGNATRAYVDIELQEVPPYQVSSGRDIAAQAQTGSLSQLSEEALAAEKSKDAKNGKDATNSTSSANNNPATSATNNNTTAGRQDAAAAAASTDQPTPTPQPVGTLPSSRIP